MISHQVAIVGGAEHPQLTALLALHQLGFGAAFALLAIGPVIAAVMALAVPETSGRELEDLNR